MFRLCLLAALGWVGCTRHTNFARWPHADIPLVKATYENASGWCNQEHFMLAFHVAAAQHRQGVFGSVGEIGVHHGKYLMPIIAAAETSEKVLAMNLFDMQEQNPDRSGKGDLAMLLANLEHTGLMRETVLIKRANSLNVTVTDFVAWGIPPFRFFSIDGGHYHEVVVNDLYLVANYLVDGAVVTVDDWLHPRWMGVTTGLSHALHSRSLPLVPFAFVANKLYLCYSKGQQQTDCSRQWITMLVRLQLCTELVALMQFKVCWANYTMWFSFRSTLSKFTGKV